MECYCSSYLPLLRFTFLCIFQVSDDEDETHPNIDTPSLFRWRHQARVDRTEEMKRERQHTEHFKTE